MAYASSERKAIELGKVAAIEATMEVEKEKARLVPGGNAEYSFEVGDREISSYKNEVIKDKSGNIVRINKKTGKPYEIVENGIPLRIAAALKKAQKENTEHELN